MKKRIIQPVSLPDPRSRYNQGLLTEGGRLLFIAGQTAVDASGTVVGKGDIEKQTEEVWHLDGRYFSARGAGVRRTSSSRC